MPAGRSLPDASEVGGRVYVIGGGTFGGPTFSSVDVYDPATDTWTSGAPMPTARLGLSTSAVNGRIYAIGGARDFHPATGMSTVEEYDLVPPPPDFNGDGHVDGKDVLILAGAWGLDDPLCDIAPPPFGDGLVDLEDLIALADYIGKEVDDRTLIAHWPLDEAEGLVAKDRVAGNDAVLVGEPIWQADAGQVGGALLLDGLDDCAITESVLNPAEGSFSVLVWIQGGAPGQVILAQDGGANWLMADATSGGLRTELKGAGRNACATRKPGSLMRLPAGISVCIPQAAVMQADQGHHCFRVGFVPPHARPLGTAGHLLLPVAGLFRAIPIEHVAGPDHTTPFLNSAKWTCFPLLV